jgi:MFS family permease
LIQTVPALMARAMRWAFEMSRVQTAAASRQSSVQVGQPFAIRILPSLRNLLRPIGELLANPMVRILMFVFVGANFVAMIFLTWMPSFLYRKFNLSLAMSGVSATAYLQIASVLGVLSGGVLADRLTKRNRAGRMITQAFGLTLGVPFIFLAGWTLSVPVVILALTGFGYFKGLYDANIWASLHDVVRPERRASAVGLMNSIGWIGGGIAVAYDGTATANTGTGNAPASGACCTGGLPGSFTHTFHPAPRAYSRNPVYPEAAGCH